MTKERAKEFLPIIQAYAEGKVIQYKVGNHWETLDSPDFNSANANWYRIKPEPKYRPFKDCDELIATWAKMMGYPAKANTMPLIWVRSNDGTTVCISSFGGKHTVGLSWFNTEAKDIREMFNNFTFLDGSPFGVEEQ